MQFKIISAVCSNNGIGMNKNLPWNIKEDLRFFSKKTKGAGNNAIVMGKNTWISIGEKPLPKRDHLILSKTLYSDLVGGASKEDIYKLGKGCKVFKTIEELKIWCVERNYEEIWIIGGESIYKQFINDPDTKEIYITNIKKDFECDTFFPMDDMGPTWTKHTDTEMETSQDFDVRLNVYSRDIGDC